MHKSVVRGFLALLVIAIYFTLLRPARAEFNNFIYAPIISHSVSGNPDIVLSANSSSVSNSIQWGEADNRKELNLKVPFGLHFLLGMLGLILIVSNYKFFGYLILIQLIGAILGLLSFYIGSTIHFNFLIITDLIARYLVPLCSLGIVPLAFIDQRQVFHERQASKTKINFRGSS